MYRLVLADDNRTTQKVVRLSFAVEGFQVECFSDGNEALAYLRKTGADLVMADVLLPGKDGYELCRHVKWEVGIGAPPVILLASSIQPVDTDRLALSAADAVLTKPFETARLIDLVEQLIARRRAEQEALVVASLPVESVEEASGPDALEEPALPAGALFELTIDQCRADFQLPARAVWRSAAIPDLSEEQYQKIIDLVTLRLPETLRVLVPQVAREVLGR